MVRRGRRCRRAVGQLEAALDAARRKSLELQAIRAGIVQPQPRESPVAERLTLGSAIDSYLDFVDHHRTYLTYRYTLDTLLRRSCTRLYVEEVERNDILEFMTACYKQGLSHRTVYDKLVVVLQSFKRYGKAKLIHPSDWPDYVETIRPIYEPEEIEGMLRHATDDEAAFIKFMLASGFRDREARFLLWRDVDFRNSLVRVAT